VEVVRWGSERKMLKMRRELDERRVCHLSSRVKTGQIWDARRVPARKVGKPSYRRRVGKAGEHALSNRAVRGMTALKLENRWLATSRNSGKL
jgi:hypothetical protein